VLRLRGQPLDVLEAVVERPGEVVTREDLRRRLWPDGTTVDFDHSLNTAVNKLRDVLRDSVHEPRFIETLPRVGYRFLAPVEWRAPGPGEETATPPDASPSTTGPPGAERPPGGRRPGRAAAIAVALVAVTAAAWRLSSPRPGPGRTMIAVLPFDNLSGDPELEYLSDGFTEEILTVLGKQGGGLGVIGRTSVMRYKRTKEPIDAIGRSLGVEYVVEGSIRREVAGFRVSAQLIRVRDQTHVWAESYDAPLQDLVRTEVRVARQIVRAVGARVRPEAADTRSPAPSPTLPEVREAYLKGRYFWNKRDPEGFAAAVAHFSHALDLDPEYAPAWAGLADCHFLMGTSGYALLPAGDAFPRARREAERALALDPGLVEAIPTLAAVKNAVDYDWAGAEALYRRAIQLNPSYATAHQWYALQLSKLGRHEEALAEAREARRLDPLSLIIQTVVGLTLRTARQPEAAEAECRKALAMDQRFPPAWGCVATTLSDRGRHADAIRVMLALPTATREQPSLLVALVYARAGSGDRAAAAEDMKRIETRAGGRVAPAYFLAEAHAGLGDLDGAFVQLEKAYAARDTAIEEVGVDPFLDPLRGDPRYRDLRRRVGLANESN